MHHRQCKAGGLVSFHMCKHSFPPENIWYNENNSVVQTSGFSED